MQQRKQRRKWRQHTEWEEIFETHVSDKGLIAQYWDFYRSENKPIAAPPKYSDLNMSQTPAKMAFKDDTNSPTHNMKIHSSHSVIRGTRLSTRQRAHSAGCQMIRTANNSHSPTYYLTTNLQFHQEQMWLFFCVWHAQNPSLPRCQLPEKQGQCLLSQLFVPWATEELLSMSAKQIQDWSTAQYVQVSIDIFENLYILTFYIYGGAYMSVCN